MVSQSPCFMSAFSSFSLSKASLWSGEDKFDLEKEVMVPEFFFFCMVFFSVCFLYAESPSVGLLFALFFSLISSGEGLGVGVPSLVLFLVTLVVVGGLFVTTSFVVLSQPSDFELVFTFPKKSLSFLFLLPFLGQISPTSSVAICLPMSSGYLSMYFMILMFLLGALYVLSSLSAESGEMFPTQ